MGLTYLTHAAVCWDSNKRSSFYSVFSESVNFCLPDVLSEKRFRSWNSDKKQVVNYTEVINVVSFLLGDICSHK